MQKSISVCSAIALSLFLSASAMAQETELPDNETDSKNDPSFVPPSWAEPPSPPDDYPDFASSLGLKAFVRLKCTALTTGALSNCKVEEAVPRGMGFEAISLNSTHAYRFVPARDRHGPRKASVVFTIHYAPEDEVDLGRWKGPKPTQLQISSSEYMARRILEDERNSATVTWDLIELDPDVRVKAQSLLDQFPYPQISDEAFIQSMSQAWGYVLAKRGYAEFPLAEPKDWPQWQADFAQATNDVWRSTNQDFSTWAMQLKTAFCAIHECGPQD